jgi:hypothetical protein
VLAAGAGRRERGRESGEGERAEEQAEVAQAMSP